MLSQTKNIGTPFNTPHPSWSWEAVGFTALPLGLLCRDCAAGTWLSPLKLEGFLQVVLKFHLFVDSGLLFRGVNWTWLNIKIMILLVLEKLIHYDICGCLVTISSVLSRFLEIFQRIFIWNFCAIRVVDYTHCTTVHSLHEVLDGVISTILEPKLWKF